MALSAAASLLLLLKKTATAENREDLFFFCHISAAEKRCVLISSLHRDEMICSSEEEITTKLKCFATRENYFNKIIVLNNIPFKLNMSINRYFLPDFIEIQRNSFRELLDKGLIEEFSKRNPINNVKKDLELYFYPEYYKLTVPEFNPKQAILNSKSYTSKLYMPVQLTDKISKIIKLKWVYIGNLPLMTKRGHFILNGSARVIVNQIIRSPGIYYQQKL